MYLLKPHWKPKKRILPASPDTHLHTYLPAYSLLESRRSPGEDFPAGPLSPPSRSVFLPSWPFSHPRASVTTCVSQCSGYGKRSLVWDQEEKEVSGLASDLTLYQTKTKSSVHIRSNMWEEHRGTATGTSERKTEWLSFSAHADSRWSMG